MKDIDYEFDNSQALWRAINRGAISGVAMALDIIANDARRRAPQRTSQLKESIQAYPVRGSFDTGIEGTVSAGAPYATYVEFGTGQYGPRGRPYKVKPVRRKALRWAQDGDWVFSKGHMIRGSRPQPFLAPAVEENTDAIAEAIGDAIEDSIDSLRKR